MDVSARNGALPANIALLDAQGRIVSVNEAWRQGDVTSPMQGPQYCVGHSYPEICDSVQGDGSADAHRAAAGIRSVLSGQVRCFSLDYSCRSESLQRWFSMTVTPLASGSPIGVVVMHLDVTARRLTQQDLQASERRFRQLADSIRDVFFLVDADGKRMVYVSPAYEETWRRSRASLYADPQSWADAIHPDDQAAIRDESERDPEAAELDLAFRIVRPDGSIRCIETRGFLVRDRAGKVVRIGRVAEDVTERKGDAQRLRESERRFSDLLQNVELAAVILDRDARITYCNDFLLRLTGWQQEEVIGRDWFETFMPPVPGDSKPGFLALLAGAPEASHRESEILTRTAERRLIRWNNSVLRSGAGDVVGVASIGEDITQRAHAADRIAYLNRVYAMLSGINTLLMRVHDRDELFTEGCRIAVDSGGFRMSLIATVDTSANIVPVASGGKDEELLGAIKSRLSSQEDAQSTMVARAIREKAAIVSNDSRSDPRLVFNKKYSDAGVRSLAILPLLVADEAVGVLALYASEVEFFHAEEMKLLTALAGDISFALDHIAKEEKIERLSRIQAVMSGINALIVRVHDSEELFDGACRVAVEHGKFGLAWMGAFDASTQEVTPVAWAGKSSDRLTRAKTSARADAPEGQGAIGQSIRERRPIVDNDLRHHGFGGPRRDEVLRMGFRSQITLPVFEHETVVATLTMYADVPNYFDAEELRLLTELASDISFGLTNITRQQQLDKLARMRAVSSQLNATIIRLHDGEALLRETCRIAVDHGKFGMVWIALVDQARQSIRPVAWSGFSPEVARHLTWTHLSTPESTLGEVVRTRRIAVRQNIDSAAHMGLMRQEAIRSGHRSTVCVPFMVDDSVVAAIVLFAAGPDFFDEEELALLGEVAADVSLALQALKKQEDLDYLSYYDVLTGLPNRSLFVDRLRQTTRTRAGEFPMVALILLDLERFRNMNESLGHRGGDDVLKAVAQRLRQLFHGKDNLARISSNGFGIILRDVKDAAGVVHLVENELFASFKQPFPVSGQQLRVSVKAGIAIFPADGQSAETLFTNAESALRRAKVSGNRYLFYAAEMNARASFAIALENRLRTAVEREQFLLHYQPKIELVSGRVCGLEALIRWNDPGHGLVAPGSFIPALEETGMILDVGRWALAQTVRQHAQWEQLGLQPPRIAVNVSQIQLRHPQFVAMVSSATDAFRNGTAGLALEITESLFMENFEQCADTLRSIRDMGVEISVDDFGTGYSSLSYISRLPIDALKIDRSFVMKMSDDADSMSIVAMIINLAHTLMLQVIAEGVETHEQSQTLLQLECDQAQGFLFSRPLPAEDVEALLRACTSARATPCPSVVA